MHAKLMRSLHRYFATHPLPVTILATFVLFITAWNGIRVYSSISNWTTLSVFDSSPGYIFLTGFVWAVAGLVFFEALTSGRHFARRAGLALSVIYMFWYWLDRLIIQTAPAGNVEFSALVSGAVFAIFNILLYWPSSKAFFTRR